MSKFFPLRVDPSLNLLPLPGSKLEVTKVVPLVYKAENTAVSPRTFCYKSLKKAGCWQSSLLVKKRPFCLSPATHTILFTCYVFVFFFFFVDNVYTVLKGHCSIVCSVEM